MSRKRTKCRKHRGVRLIGQNRVCPVCLGEAGAKVQTPAKRRASRANVKLAHEARRRYPRCPRYGSHRFSGITSLCPCGFKRPSGKAAA